MNQRTGRLVFDFHYRFNDDGGCDAICTRCFHNVGHAEGPEAMQRLTSSHICASRLGGIRPEYPVPASTALPAFPEARLKAGLARLMRRCGQAISPTHYLIVITIILFYALPTVLETHIFSESSRWFPCILIGDLAGCMGIYFILRKHRTAVVLYCVLTMLECSTYTMKIVSMQTLGWIMDIVPTLFIATQIGQLKIRSDRSRTS